MNFFDVMQFVLKLFQGPTFILPLWRARAREGGKDEKLRKFYFTQFQNIIICIKQTPRKRKFQQKHTFCQIKNWQKKNS